jgi:hypothetical protein
MSQTAFSVIKTGEQVRFASILPHGNGARPVLHVADHETEGRVTFDLNGRRFRTQGFRLVLIGSSGAGKSYALGVLAEEIHHASIPFLVFDQESEFAGLAELPGVEHIEVDAYDWDPDPATSFVLREGGAVVLDVGELGLEDQRTVFTRLARQFYALAGEIRRRCFLCVDEAAEIAPQRNQRGSADSREWLERFARRGRKRGVNWVFATQRPGELSKGVLAQANVKLIGRVEIINDYDAIKSYLAQRIPLLTLTRLDPGNFLLDLAGASEIVQVRPRLTTDMGGTPTA